MRSLILCGILGSIVSFFTLLLGEPNETLLFFGEIASYAIWVILGGLVWLVLRTCCEWSYLDHPNPERKLDEARQIAPTYQSFALLTRIYSTGARGLKTSSGGICTFLHIQNPFPYELIQLRIMVRRATYNRNC